MTRLSASSSSSSSASSSPLIFNASANKLSSSNQFHQDSSEDTSDVSNSRVGTGNVEVEGFNATPARDAALVIQRAYRRYSMVKEFQRIKTERRLSRRIHGNGATIGTQDPSSHTNVTTGNHGYEFDDHLGGHDDDEVEIGDGVGEDEESSIHSGELSQSPSILPPPQSCSIEGEPSNQIRQYNGTEQWNHSSKACSSSSLHPSYSSPQVGSLVINVNGGNGSHSVLQQQNTNGSEEMYHLKNISSQSSQKNLEKNQLMNGNRNNPMLYPQGTKFEGNMAHPGQVIDSYSQHPQRILIHGSSYPNTSLTVCKHGRLAPTHHLGKSLDSSNSSSSAQHGIHLRNGCAPPSTPAISNSNPPSSRQLTEYECEVLRKRLYRVGLNLFNEKPETGITYLVKKKFVEPSPASIARFLVTRKGLSKQMIGEYLGNLQNPFNMATLEYFASEIDLTNLPIDLALRRFQSFLRMPGEAQKIERIMETFSRRYETCNPHITNGFRNGADTVFVLAFSIIMLNTDLHTPHLKANRRMKLDDFIRNLRGIDDGADVDKEILASIYERIKQTEFRTGSDHVTQVMKVQQTIVGKKQNLALPHRRLVCYCRLYEIMDINEKEKSGSHQREVFLFNDILVLTKIYAKKRNSVTYSFRSSIGLAGISLYLFSNQYYEYGLCLKRGDQHLLNLNARNEHDRAKFAEDLREAIEESDEMVRIKNQAQIKTNRDSGVDIGKIKRYSNSLLDIHEQCKPVRRGSCGSLDSGMSVSFNSEEQQQSNSSHQSGSCASSTTAPTCSSHQCSSIGIIVQTHQPSPSTSNSSNSSQTSSKISR